MILGVDNEFHRRVNVVLDACARCIRILFADGYEIDILGDPTREAHGTNKASWHRWELRANIKCVLLRRFILMWKQISPRNAKSILYTSEIIMK